MHERRDPAHGDPAVLAARTIGLDLQVLRAIALRHQVLRWDLEGFAEHRGDRLGAMVGERQVVDVVTDSVGVALDQEHLVVIARDHPLERFRHGGELGLLLGPDVP